MSKRIHIVSFDVPFPADYGGVIDVFSRIKWFSENGWEVVLHCFEYKRPPAKQLEKYAEVIYYKRPRGLKFWFSKTPFIVNTRINKDLESALKNTSDEVLLEGLHCAHYLNIQPGKFYLRTHNIEHEYYSRLAKNASSLKKKYYKSEAKKLKSYEAILSKAKGLLVISEKELDHFKQINPNSVFVPPYFKVEERYKSTEPFVLFQGNLSVEENDEAAIWILKNIVPHSKEKFVIAGKNPSQKLIDQCRVLKVELIENPTTTVMDELINSARVHLLWTENRSGLKLKFLKAMASSGHVICNSPMAEGSGLEKGFELAESTREVLDLISEGIKENLAVEDWSERLDHLKRKFSVQNLLSIFTISK